MKKILLILFVLFLSLSAIASASESSTEAKGVSLGFELGWPFYGVKGIYWAGENGFALNYGTTSKQGRSQLFGDDETSNGSLIAFKYYRELRKDVLLSIGYGCYSVSGTITEYEFSVNRDPDTLTSTTYSFSESETLYSASLAFMFTDWTMIELGLGTAVTSQGRGYSSLSIAVSAYLNLYQ